MTLPPPPKPVAGIINAYPPETRDGVWALRQLIFEVAEQLPQIGRLQEDLRWGQPAFLTPETKAGSTLRLGPHRLATFAIYAHCSSRVIATNAQAFPGWDRIDGNRAVLFDSTDAIEPERLRHLIRHALTYHLSASV